MGHAGAIAEGASGSAAAKMEALLAKGIVVAEDPTGMGETLVWLLKEAPILDTGD
jgi:succinyl-CoA synthetase alpha subunit